MKHNILLKTLSLALIFSSIGYASFKIKKEANNKKEAVVAANYDNAKTYYSGIDFRADNTSLIKNLKALVSNRTAISYDGLFSAYADAEMREGTSYLYDYYSNTTKFSVGKSCGSYNGEGDCYNREHSIPKSWWGGKPDKSSQGSDPFIVIPTDGYVNNRRGNYGLGIVGTATYSSNNGYSKLGSPKSGFNTGAPSPVFEPNDEVKGDLARNMLYAYICWSTSNWTSGHGSYYYGGSNNGLTTFATNLLLKWHREDLPSEHEINRNNILARQYVHNRNPFIDVPDLAEKIWGRSAWHDYSDDVLDDFDYTDDPTPVIAPTSFSFDKQEIPLSIGNEVTLDLNVLPENANKSATWTTSDSNIVSVDNGKIKALKEGSTTITATSIVDKSVSASIKVNVSSVKVEGVRFREKEVKLDIDEQYTLNPVITPTNATNKAVIYETNNYEVISITNGVVKALKSGVANVMVTTVDGGFTASLKVIVSGNDGICITKNEVSVGEKFQIFSTSGVDLTFKFSKRFIVRKIDETTFAGWRKGEIDIEVYVDGELKETFHLVVLYTPHHRTPRRKSIR